MLSKFKSGHAVNEPSLLPLAKPQVQKKPCLTNQDIRVMSRDSKNLCSEFAVVSQKSENSHYYDEIYAVSSEGTLIDSSDEA